MRTKSWLAKNTIMKQKVKLSTYSIITSILGIGVLIALMVLELKQNHETAAYIVALTLVSLCAMALFYSPMSISVDDSDLNINRSLRIKSIPLSAIKSVELCPPTMSERRIFASGGWLGYWGKFYEPSIGKYFAYYGKASDCFLVKLKDGRQYLLGCENPTAIVEFIKDKING